MGSGAAERREALAPRMRILQNERAVLERTACACLTCVARRLVGYAANCESTIKGLERVEGNVRRLVRSIDS